MVAWCARGVALVVAGAAAAQSVWNVGPGGFADIQLAIAAAADGDVIVVADGTYRTFTLTKALTIVGSVQDMVHVAMGPFTEPPLSIQLQPGQQAHLIGLHVGNATTGFLVQGGQVTLTDVRCERPGGIVVQNATVVLQRVQSTPILGPGLTVTDSHVLATACRLGGGLLGTLPAVQASSSVCTFGDCVLLGASSVLPGPVGPGLELGNAAGRPPSVGWLVDCDVRAGTPAVGSTQGEVAIRTATSVRTHRCTLRPSSGQPAVAGIEVAAPILGVRAVGFPQLGGTYTVAFTAEPGDLVLLFSAIAVGAPLAAPGFEQPLYGLLPALSSYQLLAVADAAGLAQVDIPVPNRPVLRHRSFWLRGVDASRAPFGSSSIVGGTVR